MKVAQQQKDKGNDARALANGRQQFHPALVVAQRIRWRWLLCRDSRKGGGGSTGRLWLLLLLLLLIIVLLLLGRLPPIDALLDGFLDDHVDGRRAE